MRFHTADLLSKWGFEDGDILQTLIWAAGVDIEKVSEHEILRQVLERYVFPQIKNVVKVDWICTMHNPVRAVQVDGIDINDHRGAIPTVKLEPEFVDVPDETISAIALEVAANTGQPQRLPLADQSGG